MNLFLMPARNTNRGQAILRHWMEESCGFELLPQQLRSAVRTELHHRLLNRGSWAVKMPKTATVV